MENKNITTEDVSKWTWNLGEVILVQRARVRSLAARSKTAETEMRKLESLESLLKDAIIAQDARFQKLRKSTVASSKIHEANDQVNALKSRLREAIIEQGARARKLRTDRAAKYEVLELKQRLKELRQDDSSGERLSSCLL